MAKAKIIYDLTDLDDRLEFERANKSLDLCAAIWDILNLRKKTEYEFEATDNSNNDVFDGIEAMSEGISRILEQHNINIVDNPHS